MGETHKLVSKRTGLFNSLTEEEFQSIISHSSTVEQKAGDLIVREGEMGDALYIILSGSASVFTLSQGGEELPLALLKEGEHFGEQALLSDQPQKRNASVRAD